MISLLFLSSVSTSFLRIDGTKIREYRLAPRTVTGYSPTLFCATCVCVLPPTPPPTNPSRVTVGEFYTATKKNPKKKKKTINDKRRKKKSNNAIRTKRNRRTKTTKGNDHIVGYGDAVRGRGLLRPGAVLSVPQKSPRAPGLRLPIRSTPQGGHRVTIGTCLKISILSSCGPTCTCWRETSVCTEALPLSFYCLSFTFTHICSFLVFVWATPSFCLYIFLSHFWTSTLSFSFRHRAGKARAYLATNDSPS